VCFVSDHNATDQVRAVRGNLDGSLACGKYISLSFDLPITGNMRRRAHLLDQPIHYQSTSTMRFLFAFVRIELGAISMLGSFNG
jgi:hypothetical protein